MIVQVNNNETRYSIIQKGDNFFIESNSLQPLKITVKELLCGQPAKEIKSFVLNSGSEVKLSLNYLSGEFGIFVGEETEYSVYVINFLQVIDTIIYLTKDLLCGCGCEDCSKCKGDSCYLSKEILKLLTLILSYYIVKSPRYERYFKLVADNLKCEVKQDLICQINNLILLGHTDDLFFLKRIVGFFYLMFYLEESFNTSDFEELEYVKKKFKYNDIKPCLKKIGIFPENITEEILSGVKVKYWQFGNTVENIDTVVNAWTPTYLDTIPGINERSLEDFEQGVTVPYTKIGRAGFAIYETQLQNYTILDSLGNDVTDNFDMHYFPMGETVVFVSKVPYSHSNIYFKFKKNIYA